MIYLLTHLFDAAAQRFPDNIAVRHWGESVTYAELQRRVDRVAGFLAESGVRPGDRVAILLHKGIEAVVGVLAVMKAGAAYVPLDPASPSRRWSFIVEDCGCRCLIASSSCLARWVDGGWKPPTSCRVLVSRDARASESIIAGFPRLHSLQEVLATSTPPPCERITECDLAYVLYTSGSTGRPKGVMISHRASLTFVQWAIAKFSIRDADRVTSHAPLHFDLSTFDIFSALGAGATVVIVPERVAMFPVELVRLLVEERITVTYVVPSLLTRLVMYADLADADLSALRCVLFAGEVFPVKHLRRLMTLVPGPRYFNLYGPTETNVCTYYEVTPADVAPGRIAPVPIGVACENVEVFAVADDGSLITRAGQTGELYVRGPGVAHGYWNDPRRTEAAFCRNPFRPEYQDRVYKTGDIVRLAEDGVSFVYCGRRDLMVKTRGHRVELGELEACLQGHPLVEQAAVVAEEDELAGARLIAFVVPKKGEAPVTETELRSHCRGMVPRYMIPERFEVVSSLPLTSTGKVDRMKLQNHCSSHSGDGGDGSDGDSRASTGFHCGSGR